MNAQNTAIGFTAALVTGFVLGLLFAPDKGADTRRRVTVKVGSYTNGLKEIYEDLLTEVVQKIDTMIENRTDISLHP
jgi:gas vesicle protein